MRRLFWLVILFALFLLRLNFTFQANRNLDRLADKPVKITGTISSQIILQDNYQSFNLGRIKVYTQLYPSYQYGDRVVISGSLKRKVINPWYSRFSLSYPDIKKIDSGSNFFIGLKSWLESNLRQNLPEPESILTAGIVLGAQSGMSREFWQALQQTGTLHIVVASGFNVSVILGTVVGRLSGLVRRRLAVFIGILAVGGYSFMVGWGPAIIRAALMGSLAYLGQALGRQAETLRLLLLTAVIMILISPLIIFDVGFQLSFLATLGLILLCPRLTRIPGMFRESLAAQIFVWPVLLLNFHQLNPFVILINGLIVWMVPYIMFFGTALAITGWPIFTAAVYVLTHLMVKLIYVFA